MYELRLYAKIGKLNSLGEWQAVFVWIIKII
jgi:hypothetical protein